jgi:hypothetical protein
MKNLSTLILAGVAATAWSVAAADADEHAKWDLSKLDGSKLPPAAATKGLTYAKDIKPILEASCFNCHGEQRQRGDLRLDSLDALLKGGENGKIIEPGSSAKSRMVFASAQVNDDIAMPPKRPPGGRGGPGGPGGFQPPPEMVKRFDKDGDGKLNDGEQQAMRAEFQAQRGGGPGGPGGQPGNRPPGAGGAPGQGGPGGPGGGRGGPPAKPLTPEQVGILRAWIDQGAK